MQKNILITGAAGFLGKSLSINLLEFNPIRLILGLKLLKRNK